MMDKHEFDEFYWCRRCGQGAQDVMDFGLSCIADSANVTPISHLVRGRVLRELAARTTTGIIRT